MMPGNRGQSQSPFASARSSGGSTLRDHIRADGSLAHESRTGTIHGLGKDLQGAPSCNGWAFWHFERAGKIVPVDAARQDWLLANED